MSKQSEAKTAQGYEQKPVAHVCMNCRDFASDRALTNWMKSENDRGSEPYSGRHYTIERDGVDRNLRCLVGGFAVNKTSTCRVFIMKVFHDVLG